MAYAQNTITSANAANDLATVLTGLLTTAGWTSVETLTPSGNYRNAVYKSPGTANLCGYDWYIAVCWTTIGTENYVEVWAGSTYNAGTHLLSGIVGPKMPENGLGTQITAETTGNFITTSLNMSTKTVTPSKTSVSFNTLTTNGTVQPGFQTLIPSSAFAYWVSITLDHVGIFTTVATNFQNAVFSTLALDAAYSSSALYSHTPLVCFTNADLELSAALIGPTAASGSKRAINATFSQPFGAKLPSLVDEYYPAYAWRPYLYLNRITGTAAGSDPFQNTSISGGLLVGSAPDIYFTYGGSVGDTVTISGATYVLTAAFLSDWSADKQPTIAMLVE